MNAGSVTCLVPTHNRPHFLRRWLRFYQNFPPGFAVLVVDSSAPAAAAENQALVAAPGGAIAVSYLHLPFNFYQKLAQGLELVKTPYVTLCADDDIIMPDAVQRSADFLEQHPEYGSALGRTVKVYPRRRWFAFQRLKGYSIEHSDPLSRCRQMARNFFTNFYAVHRTTSLRSDFRLVAAGSDGTANDAVGEALLSQLSVIGGRVKLLPCLHLLIERHPAMGGILYGGRWANVVEQFQMFRRSLVGELAASGVDRAVAEAYVDHQYHHFSDPVNPRQWRQRTFPETLAYLLSSTGERLGDVFHDGQARHRRPMARSDYAGSEVQWQAAIALMRQYPDGLPAPASSVAAH